MRVGVSVIKLYADLREKRERCRKVKERRGHELREDELETPPTSFDP